ncbi:MAG: hypothetical protein MUO38_03430, partial [Anaerolineales bacterium]|nr:hypothetical protein [Anaerolineales bacterium]
VAIGTGFGRALVLLISLANGETLHTLEGHHSTVNQLAFSPDGGSLASVSADGGLRVWNVETGEAGLVLDQVGHYASAVAYSPDGSLLVAGNDAGEVRLYSPASGTLLATLTGHTDAVTGAAFTPDGRVLLTSSTDGTVRLWAIAPEP